MQSPERMDAVVVGGGIAGLTAAALLARSGRRVALFERSHTVGGRAVTTVDHGFHFNLGPHAWYTGGPGTRVLDSLGVPIPGRSPRPAGNFAVRAGRMHTLPVGFISLLTTDLLGVHGKVEVARILASISRMDTSAYDHVTVGQWLREQVGDAGARDFVGTFIRIAAYANAPEIMSAGAGLAALQMVVRDNVRYVDGGWQTIIDALRAKAKALGVEMHASAPVAEVLHDDGVRGVRLASGQELRAGTVVLAVDPATVARLAPAVPPQQGSRWAHIPAKAATLDLGLKRLPRPGAIAAFGIDRPLYYSVHSATAKLTDDGGALIHVAKYLPPSMPSDAKADERELEQLMDTLQPGWRTEVVARRYLPSMTVAHAIPTAAAGGLKGRVEVAVPGIDGLFLAGDWVGSQGMLANAAVASGARAAQLASLSGVVAGAVA